MNGRAARALLVALFAIGSGCGDASAEGGGGAGGSGASAAGGASPAGAGGAGGAGEGGSADPVPTEREWAELQKLAWTGEPPDPDVTNAFAEDEAAAAFGQRLFFDARFSGPLLDGDNDGTPGTLGHQGEPGKVACASCHVPEAGFSDDRSPHRQISLAAGWVIRRTPSLLGAGHKKLLHWDGRRDTFFGQAVGVVEATHEMNSSRYFLAKQLFALHRAEYESIFGPMPPLDDLARFPPLDALETGCPDLDAAPPECAGRPGDEGVYDALAPEDRDAVTRVAVSFGKALGAYVRELECGPGRFDAWLGGDEAALDASEKRGALLFIGAGKCAGCHAGPHLTDHAFHNVGLLAATVAVVFLDKDDPGAKVGIEAALVDPLSSRSAYSDGDDDRLPATVDDEMLGAFSTPSLRCVSTRPSFMHTAQMAALDEVVSFFAKGGHPAGYPGQSELEPLDLDPSDKADLVAFLKTLDGAGPPDELLSPP